MAFQVFSGVFASVSEACFKCFICLQTYVANISSECFKVDRGVAHVAKTPMSGKQRPGAFLARRAHYTTTPRLAMDDLTLKADIETNGLSLDGSSSFSD
jgi:hypothetical protein